MNFFITFILAVCAFGSTPAPPTTVVVEEPLDRIAIIGASVTWGFGTYVEVPLDTHVHRELINLNDILEASITADHEIVIANGALGFFQTPLHTGRQLATEAKEAEPTLLVALDFLFWYGYGSYDKNGKLHSGTDSRLAMLEVGLKQLDAFDCPIIICDFPDMRPAVGFMISESQIPSPEGLAALNTRLKTWADAHENVILLPLAELTKSIQADKGFQIEELTWPAGSLDTIIMADQLHPTTDGSIALTQLALRRLDAKSKQIDANDYLRQPDAVRNRLESTALREAREAGMTVQEGNLPPSNTAETPD